ncbi:glycosyl transferase family 1 [Mycobacterium colombiense]|uniref:Glycosyl transferase family 1 n=1 Tax=Mycobacterium colombiense TaxID=339268 RepID=A0A1A2SQV0_9MYCO|nr:glycosyltransferase family 1 protein [Mycobacterium colombiense]OBH66142.1 glycosyl transferase family 1 [Mycobacterium colombiense]
MKVAFDHHIFCIQQYGGVSRYFFELASRLPAHDVADVSVVAPLHINGYLAADSAGGFTHGRYVPSKFKGVPLLVGLADRLAAPLAWRGTNPDIVHETYFSTKPFGKARRRVVTVYDMIHELFMPEAKLAIAAKRAAVDRADHVICISENTRQDLVRLYGVDPARTSVVHLGHSLTVEANTAALDSDGQRPLLLYVGHRGGYKNFSALLQAFGSSPVLREFDLVAFGGYPVQRHEQQEIERLGITTRVRFESGSDRDLAVRYRAAAAFVFPSKYEGFGIPPLEAMSHGCPVVCSNSGAIREVVGDAGAYFDPNNPEELRTTLERVVTDEVLQADLRARGYERIAAFSWDKCAADTARIYREIV